MHSHANSLALIEMVAAGLVLVGAAFLSASFAPARRTLKIVSLGLKGRWRVSLFLMYFFFAGYLLFDAVLIAHIPFPQALVTGGVFLGGAIFVYIVIRLTESTVKDINSSKCTIEELNTSLEHRVRERTDELERSQKSLLSILNSMPYGIMVVDRNKRIRSLNSVALSLTHYLSEDELINQTCHHTLCPAEVGKCPILDLNMTVDRSEKEVITKDGRHIPILKTVVPIELDGEPLLLEAFIDITERKQAEEKIRSLAYYDSLTNLPNRTFYKELLNKALESARRHKNMLAVLFVNLDAFKRINDTLGHDAGDQLLQKAAERLLKAVRKSDYVARQKEEEYRNTVSRLGGDEFIVLLDDIAQEFSASVVARRILEDLAQPFLLEDKEIFITASIGISLFPADGSDVETLFRNADIAMYYAKEQGKNNFQFYTKSMNTTSLERLNLTNELYRALERDELVLYYQPKFELATRRVVGMEALIRWKHPAKGLVSPDKFIPLAEETGLIVPIGDWVMRKACMQNRDWQKAGCKGVPVSINISRYQFGRQDFIQNVIQSLVDSKLDAEFLELEITESTLMQDPDSAADMLKTIKSAGIKVSIDDFGTGYSSLDHLRWLPLDALKIDRSFVTHITDMPQDAAITKAIIALAHSLHLRVIAEGVETEAQCAFLQALGCNEGQGFLFSRPVPTETFEPFLR